MNWLEWLRRFWNGVALPAAPRDVAPPVPAENVDRVGERIGRYQLLKRLGFTAGTTQYLAITRSGEGPRFVEFAALRGGGDFMNSWLMDQFVLSGHHPNVMEFLDGDSHRGKLFFVTEIGFGLTLDMISHSARKHFRSVPIGFSVRAIHDVCLGLQYAHWTVDDQGQSLGIVHRGVEPSAVHISFQGEVKLRSFESQAFDGLASGLLGGKIQYLSPEQGHGLPLDGRSDIFSAGICLHESLTGERLFLGDSDLAILRMIVHGVVIEPSTVNPLVSAALSAAVLKALAKKPEDRFKTAGQFAQALEDACPEMFTTAQMSEYMKQHFETEMDETAHMLGNAMAAVSTASGSEHSELA